MMQNFMGFLSPYFRRSISVAVACIPAGYSLKPFKRHNKNTGSAKILGHSGLDISNLKVLASDLLGWYSYKSISILLRLGFSF